MAPPRTVRRLDSHGFEVGLTRPNMFSSSVPGSGPTMSSAGNLESGFEFFRSRYVVVVPEFENFFQRVTSTFLPMFRCSSYSSNLQAPVHQRWPRAWRVLQQTASVLQRVHGEALVIHLNF
ncbi:hypothetical protein GQ600_3485 [Phytophthora cactorum]|nr:hypothetical protein GQ600_3485 [Phytophthora cactorum]